MVKNIIRQFSFLVFLFLFLGGVFGALSEEAKNIKFLNLNVADSSKVNRVSYEITYLQDENIVFTIIPLTKRTAVIMQRLIFWRDPRTQEIMLLHRDPSILDVARKITFTQRCIG